MLLLVSWVALPAQPSREYQLKAAFLFNFTRFVEWPAGSFSSGNSPMVIGILGTDPFGSYLDEAISGEKIDGHPLIIQRYDHVDQIVTCQVLFINITESNKREQVLAKLKGKNILTVSDAPDFMPRGGMIRFYTSRDKIKLQVNLETARLADLVISSKLLRLVEIYVPSKSSL
jgi:hypothetical protein